MLLKKIYCELNRNYVHLLLEIVEIELLVHCKEWTVWNSTSYHFNILLL